MKRQLLTLLAFMLIGVCAMAQDSSEKRYAAYAVGFYNLENLFDTEHDEGKNDFEYLPEGKNKWNELKYSHKLHNMATVLSEMGTDVLPGVGCAFVGSKADGEHQQDDGHQREDGACRKGIDRRHFQAGLEFRGEEVDEDPDLEPQQHDGVDDGQEDLVEGFLGGKEGHVGDDEGEDDEENVDEPVFEGDSVVHACLRIDGMADIHPQKGNNQQGSRGDQPVVRFFPHSAAKIIIFRHAGLRS